MAEECSVAVGVRIRPFNDRERALNAQLCVEVDGPTTILQVPPEVAEAGKNKEPKKFTFDASFWSHDGFEVDAKGYCYAGPGSRYADQQLVFDTFGRRILDSAWEGYHCCLFAYGQTGAGKSYSMVGYGANKGIVPISCEEIFKRIGANTDANLTYEVMVSMVEIYNEQVQDLLVPPRERPKKGLEIRESEQLGIFIAGVSRRAVDSYSSIEAVVEEGTENRTVGSTLMNATSSRAHTVLTIEFKQVSQAAGQQGQKLSLINLVDLAGSEKAGQTGASGDRLKEGCAINKSLSALGNVIEKLADKAMGKAKANAVVPYRDSKLTRLLQNALGGSSKTVMICAISPASSNYEETLSTLRYADRAKRIKNTASINENPQDKLIRQLREENEKLRNMVGSGSPKEGESEDMFHKQAEIAALEQALMEMQKSFAERLSEAQKAGAKKEKSSDTKLPHIANLNEDLLLTAKLKFAFKEGITRVGRGSQEDGDANQPEVALQVPGIHQEHALVENKAGAVTLTATDPEAAGTSFVNGTALQPGVPVSLSHGDRVAFGQCIFVFVEPSKGKVTELINSGQVSYAAARKELQQGEVTGPTEEELKASRQLAEELERKAREAEEAKEKAKAEADALMKQREAEFRAQMETKQKQWEEEMQQRQAAEASEQAQAAEQARLHAEELAKLQNEFEERQKKAEEAAQHKIEELEKKAKKAAAEEEGHRQHELAMQRLEEQLMMVMPLVKEANLIIQELQRPHRLETKMHCELTAEGKSGAVNVTAAVMLNGVRLFEWNPETLENRVFILRELLQRAEDEGVEAVQDLPNEEDPLWDPIEVERLIGVAQVLLEGVLLQVENKVDARILSSEGQAVGTLKVEIIPIAKDGSLGIPDEEVVEDPEELLGACMKFLVAVPGATGLPEALAHDVRAEYTYFIDEKPHQLPTVFGQNCNPEFNYSHTFTQDPVTSRFLEYLQSKLVFRVFGRDSAAASAAEELARAKEKPPVPPAPVSAATDAAPQPQEAVAPAAQAAPKAPALPGEVSAGDGLGVRGAATDDVDQSPKAPDIQQTPSQANVRLAAEEAVSPPPPEPAHVPSDRKKSKFCAIL
ncbi:KIF13A [Symbiodinium microadriaticum]|nr:KIF13A [Symbiodinium microadriaticum]